MIIFIAFMSIATASAMDDSSSVSLDDSSNYNASDLELNLGDAGSNLLSSQDSISSEDSDDLASTSHEEFESANLDSKSEVNSNPDERISNSNGAGSNSNVLSSSDFDVLSSSSSNVLSASEFVIYEKDYNTYFGSDGKAKASINKAGNIIKLAGTFKNKTFIFTVPLTVTSYNSNTRLYDCIVSFEGGSGTSSNYAKV